MGFCYLVAQKLVTRCVALPSVLSPPMLILSAQAKPCLPPYVCASSAVVASFFVPLCMFHSDIPGAAVIPQPNPVAPLVGFAGMCVVLQLHLHRLRALRQVHFFFFDSDDANEGLSAFPFDVVRAALHCFATFGKLFRCARSQFDRLGLRKCTEICLLLSMTPLTRVTEKNSRI